MSRNSIGQFIAALRKANGMTQQEMADRLNVSNKAVSRWERDECAPDISLIPSIAEMFGVTCDELLKGQRIINYDLPQEDNQEKQDKKSPKVQKQLKGLVNRTLSKFKTMNYISLAVSLVGLICMFGISYGFFRPIVGFAVTLLLEVGALFLGIAALSRAKAVKADNELFEEADDFLIDKFNNTLSSFSFASFFAVLSVIAFALPLVLNISSYVNSVLNIDYYFRTYVGGIAVVLTLIFLKGRKPYTELITGCSAPKTPKNPAAKKVLIMDIVQFGLCVIALLFQWAALYIMKAPQDNSILMLVINIAVKVCGVALLAFTALFLIRNKESIKSLILPAIRNIFLSEAFGILSNVYHAGWDFNGDFADFTDPNFDPKLSDPSLWEKTTLWMPEHILDAAVYAMLVFAVYYVIEAIINKMRKVKYTEKRIVKSEK